LESNRSANGEELATLRFIDENRPILPMGNSVRASSYSRSRATGPYRSPNAVVEPMCCALLPAEIIGKPGPRDLVPWSKNGRWVDD
jgi:hypothetical protein